MPKNITKQIAKQVFRSAYNTGDLDYSSRLTGGRTEQHHKDATDINKILAQFMDTGIMPQTNPNPQYGDVSEFNFQDAQNEIAKAKTLFEELPEHVKANFENEPYKFLNFAQDEKNHDQMVEWGLANTPITHTEDNALPSGATTQVEAKAPESLDSDTVAT